MSWEAPVKAKKGPFPLILKPRDGAGASGAVRVDATHELEPALRSLGIAGRSVAI